MRIPGSALLIRAALVGAAIVVVNDLVLKRHFPGILSGKLSDVGLCVLLPLVVHAALDWASALDRARLSERTHVAVSCGIAVAYFAAVKCWPLATHAHVAWLSWLVPTRHFRAVTDPTDLVCLPFVLVAVER